MKQSDFGEFAKAMDLACGMLSKKAFDDGVLEGYFSLFEPYSIQDIKKSLNTLVTSSDSQYGIRPDLIIKYMGIKEAKPETIEGILAKAKAKNTPIGVVASRHIKKWDFDNCSPFELRQKAAEFIELLPNIEKDIQENGYTDHTLRLLVQYDVDPTSDFRPGVPGPSSPDQTRMQYKSLLIEDKRREEERQAREMKRRAEEDHEIALAMNWEFDDRKARPDAWEKIDSLRSQGRLGEALKLAHPEMYDEGGFFHKPKDESEITLEQAKQITGIE